MDNRKVMFWNSSSDFQIRDEEGNTYTPEEAKKVYESCNVKDCNAAFMRLVNYDFDVDAAKASYTDG